MAASISLSFLYSQIFLIKSFSSRANFLSASGGGNFRRLAGAGACSFPSREDAAAAAAVAAAVALAAAEAAVAVAAVAAAVAAVAAVVAAATSVCRS